MAKVEKKELTGLSWTFWPGVSKQVSLHEVCQRSRVPELLPERQTHKKTQTPPPSAWVLYTGEATSLLGCETGKLVLLAFRSSSNHS